MNSATQNLEDDHVYILKLIDVMEIMTKSSEPDITDLEEAVEIIKNFADGLHHSKEETLLFPMMSERGFSTQQGPVAMMLHEHSQGRAYVKEISENIELFKNGDLSALAFIYSNMLGYGELLRNHIAKENNVLFRMADQALPKEDQQFLYKQFEEIENRGIPNQQKKDFIVRIERLTQSYNPS